MSAAVRARIVCNTYVTFCGGAGLLTRCQLTPSQCSIIGRVTSSALPTAQTSAVASASTEVKELVAPAPVGTGASISVQSAPSKCTVVACDPAPSPTAQTSVVESASTPWSGGSADPVTTSHVGRQSVPAAAADAAGAAATAASKQSPVKARASRVRKIMLCALLNGRIVREEDLFPHRS